MFLLSVFDSISAETVQRKNAILKNLPSLRKAPRLHCRRRAHHNNMLLLPRLGNSYPSLWQNVKGFRGKRKLPVEQAGKFATRSVLRTTVRRLTFPDTVKTFERQ